MKKIALINDLSGLGRCSLTAAIPVISVMGIQACPLPTGILSAQTGFDSYFCDDYTDKMNVITDEWQKMQIGFDGIYSGFLAGAKQIEKVLYFLEKFKTKDNLYFLDPVMGDHGKTAKIFSEELLEGMRKLSVYADVIIPNLTELCLLTGTDYEELVSHTEQSEYIERIRGICEQLLKNANRNQKIIVTGIIRSKDGKDYMGNLIVSDTEYAHIERPYIKQSYSGTGDLFASVVCGCVVSGMCLNDSVQKAVDFLQIAISDAAKENADSRHGVCFEKYLGKLIL